MSRVVLIIIFVTSIDSFLLNPATGPCALRDDGLRCTKTGYYETVQCDEHSCYCVTPQNAIMALDTRTRTSQRISPICGSCYIYLKNLFANGAPPERTFIPKCDVLKGDFEPFQCEPTNNQCYCVSTSTGQQIQGTSIPFNNTQSINCHNIDFQINPIYFSEFVKPDPEDQYMAVGRQTCLKNRDQGFGCNNNRASIKYWFDKKTFLCLPFLYNGCGGNENSYNSKSECYRDCVMMDYSSCALQTQPAKKSDGSNYLCGDGMVQTSFPGRVATPGPALNSDGCPKGFLCQMGAFFGTCCDEKITNKYNAAFTPQCRNGKQVLLDRNESYTRALIGKACSDNFCPTTHTCEYNGIFAFCCLR